jgi:peptide/nickel transport system ATP-binding protein
VRYPVRGVGRERRYITPVDRVSFQVAPGEVLALVGESGSGKTTIGRALVRIIEPSEGTIRVQDKDVTHIRGRDLHAYRRVVQMIFQDPFGSLNPVRTIEKHLAFPLQKHRGLHGRALDEAVDQLLERVGLTPARDVRIKYPHELSGGQRQRVAIARALAPNPRFIVADEPISMLDVSIRAGILRLLNQLKEEDGLSFLYITHDLASARYFGDRIMVMYSGKIMEMAPSADLVRHPLHPYTQLLLAATPGSPWRDLSVEKAYEPPNLLETRRGCPFAHRCPRATDVCRDEAPALREMAPGHFVACHHV